MEEHIIKNNVGFKDVQAQPTYADFKVVDSRSKRENYQTHTYSNLKNNTSYEVRLNAYF